MIRKGPEDSRQEPAKGSCLAAALPRELNRFILAVTLIPAGVALFANWLGEAATSSEQRVANLGTNRVTITVSGGERVISANGIPDHIPGRFPRRGNPNTISSQSYHLQVPANPKVAAQITSAGHALFGIAVNGVPFDPATAEFWDNDPRSGWNYEANTGFLNLGLDEHNAHVQPTGAYHYHGLPNGLIARLQRAAISNLQPALVTSDIVPNGAPPRMLLLGWAADGFPIYTQYGHASALDPASPLKKLHSSYRLKKGIRPTGPGGAYDGRFTADFEYVKGSGELDECNGRFGVTPEFPQGSYHYYLTEEFPFISRFWRGTPDPSFMRRGPRPGGPRQGAPGESPAGSRRGRPGGPPGSESRDRSHSNAASLPVS